MCGCCTARRSSSSPTTSAISPANLPSRAQVSKQLRLPSPAAVLRQSDRRHSPAAHSAPASSPAALPPPQCCSSQSDQGPSELQSPAVPTELRFPRRAQLSASISPASLPPPRTALLRPAILSLPRTALMLQSAPQSAASPHQQSGPSSRRAQVSSNRPAALPPPRAALRQQSAPPPFPRRAQLSAVNQPRFPSPAAHSSPASRNPFPPPHSSHAAIRPAASPHQQSGPSSRRAQVSSPAAFPRRAPALSQPSGCSAAICPATLPRRARLFGSRHRRPYPAARSSPAAVAPPPLSRHAQLFSNRPAALPPPRAALRQQSAPPPFPRRAQLSAFGAAARPGPCTARQQSPPPFPRRAQLSAAISPLALPPPRAAVRGECEARVVEEALQRIAAVRQLRQLALTATAAGQG
eukprot:TRINITY_DN5731_c1_g1_i2.p1 TRINITY_DN5731_c1_g1~~TRINITY_DN5731_c1_g1_i2.p1  ORF type:complete len:428 (+),score=42.64 TRINITY_DN5731_c1_g1_i2:58-1284(+)